MNATFSALGVPLLRLQHLNFQFSYNFATLFVSTNGERRSNVGRVFGLDTTFATHLFMTKWLFNLLIKITKIINYIEI